MSDAPLDANRSGKRSTSYHGWQYSLVVQWAKPKPKYIPDIGCLIVFGRGVNYLGRNKWSYQSESFRHYWGSDNGY
jgi:hypothetical protein